MNSSAEKKVLEGYLAAICIVCTSVPCVTDILDLNHLKEEAKLMS